MMKIFLLFITLWLPASASQITVTNNHGQPIHHLTGTPFLTLHGFDQAHQAGFKGDGQTIIFIEPNVSVEHPIFGKMPKIIQYDVSRFVTTPLQDKSKFRYTHDYHPFLKYIESAFNYQHGNHVLGVVIGKPFNATQTLHNQTYTFTYSGGALPDAKAINIIGSAIIPALPSWYPTTPRMGIALYGFQDAIHYPGLYKGYVDKKSLLKKQHKLDQAPQEMKERLKGPIDDSLIDAFKLAQDMEGGVISISALLDVIADPLNDSHVPERVLDIIADCLEKGDKILVLAAGNDALNLSQEKSLTYFKDFAAHKRIKPRLLIAINLAPQSDQSFHPRVPQELLVSLPNNLSIELELYRTSNYPGPDLSEHTVAAFASHVISGWEKEGDKMMISASGTSQAAPLVASLCALWKQKNPELTGPQIVQQIKNTAIPIGPEDYFGKGLINAWALVIKK